MAVSAGWSHACGIRVGGEVACWDAGSGTWGPAGKFASISSGGQTWVALSCGERVSGEVRCWDGYGAEMSTYGQFVSVAVGGNYACGVHADGALECWGQRRPGECTAGPTGMDFAGVPCWGWEAYPGFAPSGPFTAVAAAWGGYGDVPTQICAVRVAGDVVCWNMFGSETSLPPAGEFRALDVSPGPLPELSCGLRPGGQATCWGLVDWVSDSVEPQWEPAEGALVSLSVGRAHACGLRAGGEGACWGSDIYGETRVPGGVFAAVSAGRYFSCGLRPNGEAECWGSNQWWEATPPPGLFTAVYAADGYACGIRPNREAECWGRDPGDGRFDPPGEFVLLHLRSSCGLRLGGEVACWGDHAPGPDALPAGPFTTISGKHENGCGLRPGGDVACWGGFADQAPPGRFEAISAAHGRVCGIRSDHTLHCRPGPEQPERRQATGDTIVVFRYPLDIVGPSGAWFGALQPEGTPESLHWVQMPVPAGPFAGLAADGLCGIRPDGRLDCWGTTDVYNVTGAQLDSNTTYETVTYSFGYWCGIVPGGRLDCAGGTNWDTFSTDEQGGDAYPPPPGQFTAVAVGVGLACGIHLAGDWIACWGPSADVGKHTPPTGAYTTISIGRIRRQAVQYYPEYYQHTCALGVDGEAVCWGDNDSGQTRVPPARLAAAPYVDIATGGQHTCALRATGEIICWGDNSYGQTETPTGPHTAITAGAYHSCALTADSEAVCWGNGVAESYIDPPADTANTEPPPGPFTAIDAGAYHTCALRPDGEVACWYSY